MLPEKESERCGPLLMTAVDDGVLVPPLWSIEVGNILMMRQRKGTMSDAECRRSMSQLGEIQLTFDDQAAEFPPQGAMVLGQRHRLTLYDATYLELAQRRRLPLATLDRSLRAAALAEGVACLP